MEPTRMTMTQVVGRRVRDLRERTGHTQDGLRQLLEVHGVSWSRPTVAQMELGKRPLSVDELLTLSVVLHVSPDTLLYPFDGSVVTGSGNVLLSAGELGDRLWDRQWRGVGVPGLTKTRAYLDAVSSDDVAEDDIDALRARRAEQRSRQATKEARERARRAAPPEGPIEVNPPEEPSRPKRTRARSKR